MKKFLLYFEETVGAVCLLVMAIFVFTNVFGRLAFKTSFAALDEISYTLFAYVIFVGSSSLYKRYGHGVIDLIVKLFPEWLQAVVSTVISLLLLGTNILLVVLSSRYCAEAWTRRTQTLHTPYSVTVFAMVLGFFCMTIHSFFFLKNIFTKKDYFHQVPIYEGIFVVDSVEDMVEESLEHQSLEHHHQEGEKQ